MAKTYWIATYRSISNPDKLAAYAQLAGPPLPQAAASSSSAARRPRPTRPGLTSAPW